MGGRLHTFAIAPAGMAFTGERYVPGITGQIRYEHLHRYAFAAAHAAGADVLDIACGEGYGSAALAQTARSVLGVDVCAATVAHAAGRYTAANLRFAAGRLTDIPAADASFDLVVCLETLEHVAEQEAAVRELRRVLRPAGTLLVSTPNRLAQDQARHAANPFHAREVSAPELHTLLNGAFPHIQLLEQRFLHGSVIAGEATGGETVLLASEDGAHYRETQGDLGRFYLLALASAAPLPAPGLSVLDGGAELVRLRDEFTHAVRTLHAQETELATLRAEVANLTTHSELKTIQIGFLRERLAASA